jgi:hypothetical protein
VGFLRLGPVGPRLIHPPHRNFSHKREEKGQFSPSWRYYYIATAVNFLGFSPAGRSGEIQRFSVHSFWTAIRGEEKAFSIVDEKAFSRGIEKVLKKTF